MSLYKSALAAALLLPLTIPVYAGPKAANKPAKEPVATEKSAFPISGNIGVQVVSEYINYGRVWENTGFSLQPSLDLSLAVYQGTGFINKVSLDVGVWESVWYNNYKNGRWVNDETDFLAGISTTFAKDFTLSINYVRLDWHDIRGYWRYNTPTPISHNLVFTLTYNDSDVLGAFALHPHFTYLYEVAGYVATAGRAANGRPDNNPRSSYYEIGITPKLPSLGPVDFSVPVKLGLGSDGFYRGPADAYAYGPANRYSYPSKTYGFFSAGLDASVQLNFIPSYLGEWRFNAAATYYNLSKNNAYNSSADKVKRDRLVFSSGINVSF